MALFAEAVTQFGESVKKQEEQRTNAQASYPWGSTSLPSTFHSSPDIAKELEKQKQWAEVNSIANHLFHSKVKGWHHLPPSDMHVAEYLEKKKDKGHTLSPANETYLKACKELKYGEWTPPPGDEKYERNEAAIAQAVKEDWSFGFLSEKVCSLASYCKNCLKNGWPLTPVQERFFAQLVNVKQPEKNSENEQRFKRECDANNAARKKHGMAPYSYEIFRRYGTGIF